MSKETCVREKRPVKETCICGKKRIKETYKGDLLTVSKMKCLALSRQIRQKRRVHVKRDVYM